MWGISKVEMCYLTSRCPHFCHHLDLDTNVQVYQEVFLFLLLLFYYLVDNLANFLLYENEMFTIF